MDDYFLHLDIDRSNIYLQSVAHEIYLLEFLLYSVLSHKAAVLATTKMRNNVFEISLHLQSQKGCQSFSLIIVHVSPKISLVLLQVILLHHSVNCRKSWAYTSSYRVFGGLINRRRGLYPPGLITRIEKALRRFFGTSLAVTDQSTFYIYWFLRYSWGLNIAFLP